MVSEFAGQRCGIYPRVSSRKQAKHDRTSLKDQENACRDYAVVLEMVVDEACVKPEPYTSTKMQRPELNQLLADMKARHVTNLIIDRVDRMTRQGQQAAMTFLQQFTRAGITLHIVSMGHDDADDDDVAEIAAHALVIRKHDDKAVKDFLDAAYAAQEDNKKRTRIVKRAKRSRAREGRYLRGSRAPYGFRYEPCEYDAAWNVTDKRMMPDERPFTERGFPTTFAPTPYAARKEMLRLYADGYSYGAIAEMLTQAGVPTATHLVKREGVTRDEWWPCVVRDMIIDPLNDGILTNFRHTYKLEGPDDKHDEEWVKQRPVPFDQQIIVTPKHGGPAPILDEATETRIALHREHRFIARGWTPNRYADGALLAGGRALCTCGATLNLGSYPRRGKNYLYYRCTRGRNLRLACAPWSMPVRLADSLAWSTLLGALAHGSSTFDSYFDAQADKQVELALRDPSPDELADLEATRVVFERRKAEAHADYQLARTTSTRATLITDMDHWAEAIEATDRKIANHKRQAARETERRAVLATFMEQYDRYMSAVLALNPHNPDHMPLIITIARTVGARFTVRADIEQAWEDGSPFSVELLISPTAAAPWFTAEQEQQLAQLDGLASHVLEDEEPDANPERPPFVSTYGAC